MSSASNTILANLPTSITGLSAWLGKDMAADSSAWLHQLSNAEISDLENGANHFLSLNIDVGEISKDKFPLTTFKPHIENLSHKILNGIGIEVLRGLPTASYSQKFAATIFCGIGSHLGSARSQNAQGHILGHVRDIGADANDPNSRIYQTNSQT